MNGKPPAILIVDDEEDACRNMADILEDFGFRVDVAYDGFGALDLVQTQKYDIALLDLKMPGMDGLTLYRKIKNLSADTIAIIVTAFAGKSVANEALTAGILKVFSKPVEFPQLMELMQQALERPLALLVDDDVDLCANVWDLLNEQGYRVCIAHDENEATARLESQEYHVVLIDMKLPQGDGRGVFEKVRQLNPTTPVIAITGYVGETERVIEKILSEGGNAVCYKPFDIPELLGTLERVIQNRKSA